MQQAALKNVAIITGTRAEYGILKTVLDAVAGHRKLSLQLLVTGTHLTTGSLRDITHPIAARVRMQKKGRSASSEGAGSGGGFDADVQALARGVAGFGEAFCELKPDVVVVLGDRIEMLAAASAASIGGRLLAHIHGGDRAEGVADEAIRHAISKMAHLHFPATATSKKRLIRMGEDPQRIFQVGSPAVDVLKDVIPADDAPELIVMQHPVGASPEQECKWMDASLKATARYNRLVFAPNHDPGRSGIMDAIAAHGVIPIDHLPRERFLSLLAGAGAIVGNSSAGLIEAAALHTPCVNVGPRQGGREAPRSAVHCRYGVASVRTAIRNALAMDRKRLRHPYGKGDSGKRIADVLAKLDLSSIPRRKCNGY